MARETKVGLLAGLAFIVCFAMILANRGRPLPYDAQRPSSRFQYVPSEGQSSATQDQTALRDRDDAIDPVDPLGLPSSQSTQPIADATPPATHPSGKNVPQRADVVVEPIADREAPGNWRADDRFRELERRLDELSRELASKGQADIRLAAPAGPIVDSVVEPEHSTAELPRAPHEASPSPAPTAPHAKVEVLTRYKVVAGDTLSRIAARHYGGQSKHMIDAMMDANRGVLTDPDHVTVGLELVIPKLTGTDPGVPPSMRSERKPEPGEGHREPVDRDHRDSVPFRWYQIKKNDRYVSIARKELGDESRWREIFDLNKDAFPDASRIRPGVRIKLPLVLVATTGEGRRP